jgi:16S rRNA (guanine527-N7)-methyltransferase
MSAADRAEVLAALEESRELGLLGPGPVEDHYVHAAVLADLVRRPVGRFLDLGSGGGLPGLVVLDVWDGAHAVLLDAQQRRCAFLERTIDRLGWSDRVGVECGRAEVLARRPDLRGAFELVLARSFGAPAVTAECAVGFLAEAGSLVVTEPPSESVDRWDAEGLGELGFGSPERLRGGETGAVRIPLEHPPDDRWPRRDGMPAKRPLW